MRSPVFGFRLSVLGTSFVLLVAMLVPRLARAEYRQQTTDTGLQVYHVVIGQGALYWEKYGHNMLWFYDPATGIDAAFNWGTFDFRAPGLLRRILVGDPLYSVEAYPGQAVIAEYRRADRTITLQRLSFTPAQARRAWEFASRNALPENKYYRYDYFRDNCSTRVRDVINLALGGALERATSGTRTTLTYRGETLRLLDDLKVTQLGVDVALGQPADRRLSTWESMFIPMRMRDAMRLVRVPGADGRQVSLVAQERVLYESPRHRDRGSAPRLWIPYLIVGLLLMAEFLAVGAAGSRTRIAEMVFRWEVGVWALLTGLAGLVLVLAWLTTKHVFWFRNENLLLLNPLALFLAVLAPLSIWRARYARAAAMIAMTMAALGVLALLLKLVPGFTQDNLALILLFVPAHVAIALGLWRRTSRLR